MNNLIYFLIAIISGAIGVFSFAPFNLWWVIFISFTILLILIRISKFPKLITFIWSVAFFSSGLYWVGISVQYFGGLPLWLSSIVVLLLGMYLSIYPTIFSLIVSKFKLYNPISIALIFFATEWLRGFVLTGFPWLSFGYSQINSPLSSYAALIGEKGIAFIIYLICALISSAFFSKKISHKIILIITATVFFIFSEILSNLNYNTKFSDLKLNSTIVQGNIDQAIKWDINSLNLSLDGYKKLIEQAKNSELFILPESSLPIFENQIEEYLDLLNKISHDKGAKIVAGTTYHSQNGKNYNSMLLLGDKKLDDAIRYNKQHLVPFGEYIPLKSIMQPILNALNIYIDGFDNEQINTNKFEFKTLTDKQLSIVPAICYEIILAADIYQKINENSNILLNISNDAWFSDSIGPWQHLQIAQMRSLEFGISQIRATNTGVSAFIDNKGNIVNIAPQFQALNLNQNLALERLITPYSKLGDKTLYILLIFLTFSELMLVIMQYMLKKVKHKNKE